MTIINQKKFQFIFNLRSSGVTNKNLLTAMEDIPRDSFLSQTFQSHAFEDIAIPIDCGQTTTQPSIIGIMCQALCITRRSKVLEIGTGSGYQTAILARLGRRVYSIERYKKLSDAARKTIESLSIANVTILCNDGTAGLVEQAPFDRIMVSAAVDDIPQILLDQLNPEGILVAPVGRGEKLQTIVRVDKRENRFYHTDLKRGRFLSIQEGTETELVSSTNFFNP
jgi:protein-L-isoaspartate(D-aspartate) O-methyltransferase